MSRIQIVTDSAGDISSADKQKYSIAAAFAGVSVWRKKGEKEE